MNRLRTGILIGGRGRRMGAPKQLLRHGERFLIDPAVEVLSAIGEPALIGSGQVPEHLQGLHRIDDAPDAEGPLAGVLGALRSNPNAAWLIVACDQPWISQEAITWLVKQRQSDKVAVMPRDPSRPQPFPGIYEPDLADLMEVAKPRAISALADWPQVRSPMIDSEIAAAWTSVNTPEDLDRLDRTR